MALAFLNKVGFTPVAFSNTDDFVVDTVIAGFYIPADAESPVVVDGALYNYTASSADGSQHEEGTAAFTVGTSTLERQAGTVRNGSSGPGTFVNFSAAPNILMGGPVAADMQLQPLDVTVVGAFVDPPVYTVVPQQAVQVGSAFYTSNNVWVTGVDMYDEGVTEISYNNLGGVVEDFSLGGANCTDVSAPELVVVMQGVTLDGPVLDTVDLSALEYVGAGFTMAGTSVVALNLSDFIALFGDLIIDQNTALEDALFPSLENGGTIGITDNTLLETIDLSALVGTTGIFNISALDALNSIDLSSLEISGDSMIFNACPALTSLSLPSIVRMSGAQTGNAIAFTDTTVNVTSFSIGAGLLEVNGNWEMSGGSLDQTSVDGILVALAALDGTGGTTSYDNFTVSLSGGTNSAPSGTGTTAIGVLTGRGNTVTTN